MTESPLFYQEPLAPEAFLRVKAGDTETVFSWWKKPDGFHDLEYVTDYAALIVKRRLLEK